MRPLAVVAAEPGPALLAALRAALDGTGPALLPVPGDRAQARAVLAALRPDEPLEADDVALVVPTSGSTGEPKGVLLTADALRASALATRARLGEGDWALALPVTHVAGLQVLVRSLVGGTGPVLVDPSGPLPRGPRFVSLVPTQLRRLLGVSPDVLASYAAVLVGGAATPAVLLAAARDAGVRVVTTYGMSETSGGCVYDGRELDGVHVDVADRVRLAGPVLARGYRLRPDLTRKAFSGGWFTTGDVGHRDADGRLVVDGRADDVVVTGGEKVAPAAVEAAARAAGRGRAAARADRQGGPAGAAVWDHAGMTSAAQWVAGARPRTLPAAVAPVLVGSGAAAAVGAFAPGRAPLALVVALALQVGVNYANDYSDGVRGTDADRVGPLRLVGSGAASPRSVLRAALGCFALAAVAGLVLALLTTLWLVALGAVMIAAAWGYTGGASPYGYRGFGEVSVFVFFGLVAVVGTTYVQAERVTAAAVGGGVGCGALACAILVTNNLRDIPSDTASGKRTLAVLLGDARTRVLYPGLVAAAFAVPLVLAPAAPGALLALLAVPLALGPVRRVRAGVLGRDLVPVLRDTGRLQLAYGVLLALGLALS